jgi:hypothetical protein
MASKDIRIEVPQNSPSAAAATVAAAAAATVAAAAAAAPRKLGAEGGAPQELAQVMVRRASGGMQRAASTGPSVGVAAAAAAKELAKAIGETRLIIQKRAATLSSARVRGPASLLGNCLPARRRRQRATRDADKALVQRAVALSDVELARFLRATGYSPEAACDAAIDMLVWRREHGVDAILGADSEFMAQDKSKALYWSAGKDAEVRPVLVVCLRRHDPQLFSSETTVRFVLWKLESKLAEGGVEDFTVLLDLKGCTMRNSDYKALKLLVPTVQRFYPSRLARLLLYPASTMSWVGFKLWAASASVSEEFLRSCVFITENPTARPSGLAGLIFGQQQQQLQQQLQQQQQQQEQQQQHHHQLEQMAGGSVSDGSIAPRSNLILGSDEAAAPAAMGGAAGAALAHDDGRAQVLGVLTDFIPASALEERYGGRIRNVEPQGTETVVDFSSVELLDEEEKEFARFMESQDARLQSILRCASDRAQALASSAGTYSSPSSAITTAASATDTAETTATAGGVLKSRLGGVSDDAGGAAVQPATPGAGDGAHQQLTLPGSAGATLSGPMAPPGKQRAFGLSTQCVEIDMAMTDETVINAWSRIDASVFKVRCGPNYHKNKRKEPSLGAIYDLVTMDLVSSETKFFHIASRTELPRPGAGAPNASGLPEYLVVSFQAPMYPPGSPFSSKTDGSNVAMSAFFRLADWARKAPENNAVESFRRFVHCFNDDPYRKRLKCIASIANPDRLGLNRVEKSLHARYDATPWMVEPQYQFFSGTDYFEIDIDIHVFNFFSKKVGWSVTERLDQAIMDASLVVQAEQDQDMPERVLCCWRANRLQLNHASPIGPLE